MYKFIGADQKEYGPVSVEQLRQWLGEGRINAQTKVRDEGSADWKTLGDLPEFASGTSAKMGPPPLPSAPLPAKTSTMAITSLVLGVLGFCGITALIGLILGIVALVKINRSQGRLTGRGLAIAGIAVSGFMLLIGIPIMAGMLLPALAKAKQKAQSIQCLNNVRQLSIAVSLYANDNHNTFPSAEKWCDAMQKYVPLKDVFLCTASDKSQRSYYAFNANLDGMDQSKITNPSRTVLFFETEGGWNVSGGPELLLTHSRHGRGVVVGFADGHVELVMPTALEKLRWQP